MKNKYDLYKIEFKNFIILFKCGNFYISINDDAFIMHNIFNHKIINTGKFFKTGFPISSLNKIQIELTTKHINHIIIDNNIIGKNKFKNNSYSNYINTIDYNSICNRINRINDFLKDNITNLEINNILNKIEKIICKTNY